MPYSISQVEKLYPNWYDAAALLSQEDQRWVWENLPLPELDKQLKETRQTTTVSLSGNVNGSRKLIENSKKTSHKSQAISKLSLCDWQTHPRIISNYLVEIFGVWQEKPDHWLYIAQYYTPKSILSVLNRMTKTHERGAVKLKSPPAYFTSVLKRFHKPRKHLRKKNYGNA